jgi:fumarate reductase flavoprotein subunit
MQSFDAVIVGGGGSGLAAACSVAERGGSVLVLEKEPELGGTTRIAVGSFSAAGTAMQRAAGVEDDPSAHADDAARFAPAQIEARNHAALRRRFLAEAPGALEWLARLGVRFEGPRPEPPNAAPRMHNAVPGARAYIEVLAARLRALGGEVLCGVAVTELVLRHGRIAGVRALGGAGETHEIAARRGVVLAAGDYAGNAEMLAQHAGPRFRDLEGVNPNARGEGQLLAASAGAVLLNMDVVYGPELRFPPPAAGAGGAAPGAGGAAELTWLHPEPALFADGAILINARGERFTNELASPERELAVAEQPGKECYLLLDARLIARYSAWPHYISTAPGRGYAYAADYEELRPDVAFQADTLHDIAYEKELQLDRLLGTVERFNRYVAGELGEPFGRQGDTEPLVRRPWLILGPARAYVTTTEGGAAIDERLRVLDAAGRPIPGLFAVGQNGLGGMVLWGHGLHIAWAMTSGRLAGESVMAEPDGL